MSDLKFIINCIMVFGGFGCALGLICYSIFNLNMEDFTRILLAIFCFMGIIFVCRVLPIFDEWLTKE